MGFDVSINEMLINVHAIPAFFVPLVHAAIITYLYQRLYFHTGIATYIFLINIHDNINLYGMDNLLEHVPLNQINM